MSTDAALLNDTFRLYVLLVGGALAAVGAPLSVLSSIFRRKLRSVWTTYCGWLLIAPVVMGCLYFGRATTIVFVSLIALLAFTEFARATGTYRDWWVTGGAYLAILAVGMTTLMADPKTGQARWFGLFMALPVYAITFLLMIPVLRNRSAGQLQQISLTLLGFICIGWMFGHLGFLANSSHPYGYLLYVLFAVEVNDIAAFVFGRLFGRHKLRSRISPAKTWEGSLGAFAVSMALPWLLGFSFPHFGALQRVLTGLIVGIGGQLGDLSISFIKRDLGIKDMGATIPGHGGILDRIDSLIFVAPLFLHMVHFFYGLQ